MQVIEMANLIWSINFHWLCRTISLKWEQISQFWHNIIQRKKSSLRDFKNEWFKFYPCFTFDIDKCICYQKTWSKAKHKNLFFNSTKCCAQAASSTQPRVLEKLLSKTVHSPTKHSSTMWWTLTWVKLLILTW